VVKWFKPGKEAFQIFLKGDAQYEPDFVVETKTAKLMVVWKSRSAEREPPIGDSCVVSSSTLSNQIAGILTTGCPFSFFSL
jgi:hypothetical protein